MHCKKIPVNKRLVSLTKSIKKRKAIKTPKFGFAKKKDISDYVQRSIALSESALLCKVNFFPFSSIFVIYCILFHYVLGLVLSRLD